MGVHLMGVHLMRASHRPHLMGVHLIGLHLILHLIGLHLTGMYLIGMYGHASHGRASLIDIYRTRIEAFRFSIWYAGQVVRISLRTRDIAARRRRGYLASGWTDPQVPQQ